MEPNRSNDAFLIVGALAVAAFLLFAGAAAFFLLRSRSAASVAMPAATTPPPPVVVTPPAKLAEAPSAVAIEPPPPTATATATAAAPKKPASVTGQLAPEEISRVVRRSMSRLRGCYNEGLKRDPSLAGRVSVRFIVDADGNVSSASKDAATTLGDATVVDCVVKVFASLTFPKPEGGVVTAVYPVVFSSAE